MRIPLIVVLLGLVGWAIYNLLTIEKVGQCVTPVGGRGAYIMTKGMRRCMIAMNLGIIAMWLWLLAILLA